MQTLFSRGGKSVLYSVTFLCFLQFVSSCKTFEISTNPDSINQELDQGFEDDILQEDIIEGDSSRLNNTPIPAQLDGFTPLAGNISPQFSSNTLEYKISLPHTHGNEFQFKTNFNSELHVKLNQNMSLSNNQNSPSIVLINNGAIFTIDVVNTSQNNSRTYRFDITKESIEEEDDDDDEERVTAQLDGFTPLAGSISPQFSPNTLEYNISLPHTHGNAFQFKANFNPALQVKLNQNIALTNNQNSPSINLNNNSASFTIHVNNTNNDTTIYRFNVKREENTTETIAAQLDSFIPLLGTLSPDFKPEQLQYDIHLNYFEGDAFQFKSNFNSNLHVKLNQNTLLSSNHISPSIEINDSSSFTIDVSQDNQIETTRYTFNLTRSKTVSSTYIKASNTDVDDRFGHSIDMHGDLLVIGAIHEDSSLTNPLNGNPDIQDNSDSNSGAVYVFRKQGNAWVQEAYLKGSNTQADDQFGTSVAVFANTIVVGAPREDSRARSVNPQQFPDQTDNIATSAGAAYVFKKQGNAWVQEAYLKASNSEKSDGFGTSVHIHNNTIIIGAPFEDDNKSSNVQGNYSNNNNDKQDSGAAYIFQRQNNTWQQNAYLKAFNSDSNDQFGQSVAVQGNWAIVGAPFERSKSKTINSDQNNNDFQAAGAAYVFKLQNNQWLHHSYLKASNTDKHNKFASSLAIHNNHIAIGAPQENNASQGIHNQAITQNNGASRSGAVYMYRLQNNQWQQSHYIKSFNNQAGDRFGQSISLDQNILSVGASSQSSSNNGIDTDDIASPEKPGSGAAYTFINIDGHWQSQSYIKSLHTDERDGFGQEITNHLGKVCVSSVAEKGSGKNINPNHNNNADFSGAVYCYDSE